MDVVHLDGKANNNKSACVCCVFVFTCVVAALKDRPSREQSPRPAATDRATSSTPASPTAPWDLAQSHLSMVTHA